MAISTCTAHPINKCFKLLWSMNSGKSNERYGLKSDKKIFPENKIDTNACIYNFGYS